MKNHVIDIQFSGEAVSHSAPDLFLEIVAKELPKTVVDLRKKYMNLLKVIIRSLSKNHKRTLSLQCRGVGYGENQVFLHPDTLSPVFSYGFTQGGAVETIASMYPFHPCSRPTVERMVRRFIDKNCKDIPDVVIQHFDELLEGSYALQDGPFKVQAGQAESNLVLYFKPEEVEESLGFLLMLYVGEQSVEIVQAGGE